MVSFWLASVPGCHSFFICFCNQSQGLLSSTAVLKLNGGLGTSMGLEKAKSLLPVKDGKSFLDLIALQVWMKTEADPTNGLLYF